MPAVAVELRKGQHRQQREDGAHRAEELAEEAGLQCHPDEDEHEQRDADAPVGRGQAQSRQAGEDLPWIGTGEPAVDVSGAECQNDGQHQIFDPLAVFHGRFGQAERLSAVQELLLSQGGQPIDEVAQAAESADIAAEEAAEQEGEAAQPQQREDEAVRCEHIAGADLQEDLFCAVEPGHEGTGHGHEEYELDGGPQPGAAFEAALALLCCRLRSGSGLFHQDAAFPSASATAPMRPSEVKVAPETVSTSVDWLDSIWSSRGRD